MKGNNLNHTKMLLIFIKLEISTIMTGTYSQLYIHIVFAVKGRAILSTLFGKKIMALFYFKIGAKTFISPSIL